MHLDSVTNDEDLLYSGAKFAPAAWRAAGHSAGRHRADLSQQRTNATFADGAETPTRCGVPTHFDSGRTTRKLMLNSEQLDVCLDAGDRIDSPPAFLSPKKEKLGNGWDGTVYAWDASTVVKVIDYDRGSLKEQRALREMYAAMLMQMNPHPNVCAVRGFQVQLNDSDQRTGSVHITMAREAGSLSSLLRPSAHGVAPLDEAAIVVYCQQLMAAMQHMHRVGLVHGDLKSDNVLVTADRVVIGDFGSSVAVNGPQLPEGTLRWRPPELYKRSTDDSVAIADLTKCDVWCFGATVLEMATGQQPFKDSMPLPLDYELFLATATQQDVAAAIDRELAAAGATLSAPMVKFIQSCLTIEPLYRSTVAELMQHEVFVVGQAAEQCTAMTQECAAAVPTTETPVHRSTSDRCIRFGRRATPRPPQLLLTALP